MSVDLEPARHAVVARYGPAVAGLRWVSLGSAGGLSGAALWRGDAADGPRLALKAWPVGYGPDRLAGVHSLMRRAAYLPFVPAVISTTDGVTTSVEVGRAWDVCRWMPGAADVDARPASERVASACTALAQLHRAWAPAAPRFGPFPAVHRRLDALAEARRLGHSAARSTEHLPPFLRDVVRRAARVVARLGLAAEQALAPWASRPVPLQPCLVDARRDHVLFAGVAVAGLVDYGAAQDDHPAVDLARLLGELAGEDETRFAAGLAAHAAAGGPPEPAPGFARLLDRTGVVGALAGWLVRLADPSQLIPSGINPSPAPRWRRTPRSGGWGGGFDGPGVSPPPGSPSPADLPHRGAGEESTPPGIAPHPAAVAARVGSLLARAEHSFGV